MEAHQPGGLVLRVEAGFHQPVPNFAGSTVFGDLLEEVVVRVEKETKARTEFINVGPATARPLHIFHSVVNRESQLLQRGSAGFAYVITADGDGVEFGSKT